MIFVFLIIFIIAIIGLLVSLSSFIDILFGAFSIQSNKLVVEEALKLVGLKRGDFFVDLGCGSGTVLAIAKEFKAKWVGKYRLYHF